MIQRWVCRSCARRLCGKWAKKELGQRHRLTGRFYIGLERHGRTRNNESEYVGTCTRDTRYPGGKYSPPTDRGSRMSPEHFEKLKCPVRSN